MANGFDRHKYYVWMDRASLVIAMEDDDTPLKSGVSLLFQASK